MSARHQKFREDFLLTTELCDKNSWPITDLELNDNYVTFNLLDKDGRFSICVSEDYPENSFLSRYDEPSKSEVINMPLPKIITHILQETGCILSNSKPDQQPQNPVVVTQRSISMESAGSSYADCISNLGSDDEDMDDYYNNEDGMETDVSINSLLVNDMESLTEMYGDKAVSYRLLDSIDEIDIELNVHLRACLAEEVLEAWGLNKDEPLIIRLHLSMTSYLDPPKPPKVEVFQPSKKEKLGVGSQLRKILETHLSQQWPTLSNDHLMSVVKTKPSKDQNNIPTSESIEELVNPIQIEDGDMAKLMEMGFSAEQSRNALILSRGDVEKALADILCNADGVDPTSKVIIESLKDGGTGSGKKHPRGVARQTSHPPLMKRLKKNFHRQTSALHSTTGPIASSSSKSSEGGDLMLKPSTTWFGKNAKQIPSLESGFLVQIYRYVQQRIPTLNEYCVVCDDPHVFQNGAMLKPAVCSRELCVFAFQTLGVMSDAAEDIATGAEVVDLLIAMTKTACSSHRKKVIFDPYPTVVDPDNSRELALNPKKVDYEKVDKILQNIIPMRDMTKLPIGEIKKRLDNGHRLAYPLLQWIISSNRSHIVKIPPEKQISFMRTPYQFLLLSSPPAKEAKFQNFKEKSGSTFAFHGSGIENWHSIIRQGLVSASGTNKQVNGAAYGKGIYLSPLVSVSSGYSRMGYGSHRPANKSKGGHSSSGPRFLSSDNITCIALCEVITSPELKQHNQIWVIPNPDHVCTRFFFVYEDGQVGDSDINTQVDKYKKEIMQAVGYRT